MHRVLGTVYILSTLEGVVGIIASILAIYERVG